MAWDHDPPATTKLVPFGILMVATSTLLLIFGLRETNDSWGDALQLSWSLVRDRFAPMKRIVIYLDNGPNNSGSRTQFLKRMVQFADWSGLEIRLVYYPPYHSKYNPVERCWSSLESKFCGALMSCVSFVLDGARRMTWKGEHPAVHELEALDYPNGVKLSKPEMVPWEALSNAPPPFPNTISRSSPSKLDRRYAKSSRSPYWTRTSEFECVNCI